MERPQIDSITSAEGWRAVYMSKADEQLFTVPLVGWAFVKNWNHKEWKADLRANAVIGLVLSSDNHSVIPAAKPDFVENDSRLEEPRPWFCGYLRPGFKLHQVTWKPLWKTPYL